MEFACFPRDCMGSLWVLWGPSTVQRNAVTGVRLTGDSKLPIDVSVSVVSV